MGISLTNAPLMTGECPPLLSATRPPHPPFSSTSPTGKRNKKEKCALAFPPHILCTTPFGLQLSGVGVEGATSATLIWCSGVGLGLLGLVVACALTTSAAAAAILFGWWMAVGCAAAFTTYVTCLRKWRHEGEAVWRGDDPWAGWVRACVFAGYVFETVQLAAVALGVHGKDNLLRWFAFGFGSGVVTDVLLYLACALVAAFTVYIFVGTRAEEQTVPPKGSKHEEASPNRAPFGSPGSSEAPNSPRSSSTLALPFGTQDAGAKAVVAFSAFWLTPFLWCVRGAYCNMAAGSVIGNSNDCVGAAPHVATAFAMWFAIVLLNIASVLPPLFWIDSPAGGRVVSSKGHCFLMRLACADDRALKGIACVLGVTAEGTVAAPLGVVVVAALLLGRVVLVGWVYHVEVFHYGLFCGGAVGAAISAVGGGWLMQLICLAVGWAVAAALWFALRCSVQRPTPESPETGRTDNVLSALRAPPLTPTEGRELDGPLSPQTIPHAAPMEEPIPGDGKQGNPLEKQILDSPPPHNGTMQASPGVQLSPPVDRNGTRDVGDGAMELDTAASLDSEPSLPGPAPVAAACNAQPPEPAPANIHLAPGPEVEGAAALLHSPKHPTSSEGQEPDGATEDDSLRTTDSLADASEEEGEPVEEKSPPTPEIEDILPSPDAPSLRHSSPGERHLPAVRRSASPPRAIDMDYPVDARDVKSLSLDPGSVRGDAVLGDSPRDEDEISLDGFGGPPPPPPPPPQPKEAEEQQRSGSQEGGYWNAVEDEENEAEYCVGGYHRVVPGDLLGERHKALCKLGWGQFSTVWLVRDEQTKELSATKVSKAGAAWRRAAVYEVDILTEINEARTGKVKIDPGVRPYAEQLVAMTAAFEHSGPHGDHVCICLEVMGPNLLKLVAAHNFAGIEPNIVRVVARDILRGLSFLGGLDIAHTDLKPENILLCTPAPEVFKAITRGQGKEVNPKDLQHTEDVLVGRYDVGSDESLQEALQRQYAVKISDFGTARRARKKYPVQAIQTREYRSPEVIMGHENITPAVDVWSLPCIVFELLTGDFLFDPKAQNDYDKDTFHLMLTMQLLGDLPPNMTHGPYCGRFAPQFFNQRRGDWKGRRLRRRTLEDLLKKDFGAQKQVAADLAGFLLPMLKYDPHQRMTAKRALKSQWLVVK
eukprot:Hpha_TRINITY_DN15912_c4_g4::TRINITY_DN15912_c4_g4_i1::g.70900::m.70900/K08832/SRPK3, STK23; serine/threonine-protein kinase SRPK3